MKSALLIASLIFVDLSAASAKTMSDLAKCVNAFSNQTSLTSSGYTTVLTPTSATKTQLLVLNGDGAKIISPSTQGLDYVFQIPGQKEIVRQQWTIENDTVAPSWNSLENSSAKALNDKNISLEEATQLAIKGLSLSVTQKSANLQKDVKQLDQWVRLRLTSDGDMDVLSSNSKKVVNEERLYSKLLAVNKSIEDLNACKNVSDEKIQELAKIELARLIGFKNKIGELKRESKKFTSCVKKISASSAGTSTRPTSPSGAR